MRIVPLVQTQNNRWLEGTVNYLTCLVNAYTVCSCWSLERVNLSCLFATNKGIKLESPQVGCRGECIVVHEHKNQLLGVKSLTRAQIWNTNSTSQVLKVLSHSAISIREGRGRNRKRERGCVGDRDVKCQTNQGLIAQPPKEIDPKNCGNQSWTPRKP